ncbi:hydroxyethylthiazole kinase [Paenibacillus sp.]|jgi:hydroxyethylthiazole kinase|uniref:hydroxyethylthiazole kinase n=1 Tax=Paenibacillus sp. TaxID=58172 RepID=UPI002838848E|nr:hydroxyethylthiazole kinase [Paenibacillus sp.]MDR0270242.1 hydroxyethylthiazole kinase [Paenibacillus sp.]
MVNISGMQLLPQEIKRRRPLIHNITNEVVTNFTANGLLAAGASPVMASASEEVADMAKMAGALVLNLGTLNAQMVEAAILAGRSANLHGIPVLLDPVGAGATPYRTRTALEILRNVRVSIVRGNVAEVANLIGEAAAIKGVDADVADGETPVDLAARAAHRIGSVVAITGREDVITDGVAAYVVRGGHPMLTRVTGTGCLLTSMMGAFTAVESDLLTAGAAAFAFYGAAGIRAYDAADSRGPGSFQIAFLDALSEMDQFPVAEEAIICHKIPAGRGFLQ